MNLEISRQIEVDPVNFAAILVPTDFSCSMQLIVLEHEKFAC